MHYSAVWKEILCRKSARKLQGKIIKTTLGGLIVVVTDEVMPIIRDPSGLYMVVSCVLSDLLAHQHVRVHEGPRRGSHKNR